MKRRSRTLLNSVFIVALLSGVAVNAVLASHFGLLGDYYGPPPNVPTAPTNVQVISACESAQVVWSPPLSDGGNAVSGYIVRVRAGGEVVSTQSVDGATFTDTATGLTDGTSYTLTVSAVNSAGEGPESTPADIVPRCVPTAPIAVVAAPLCAATRVSWAPPLHDGGSPITGYIVWVRNAGQLVATGRVDATGSHTRISDLTNGATYSVTVSALNVLGVGPPSAAVTVVPHCGLSVPSAPIEVFGTPICGGAQLDWSPPLTDGGSAIRGYVVWIRSSGQLVATDVVNGSTFTDTISGLTTGSDYAVTVAAVNGFGVGPESTAVELVPECPSSSPDPPFEVTAAPLCGGIDVAWNAPLNDGGSPIAGYTVFVRSGEALVATDNVDSSTFNDSISGLTNGTTYTVTVAATNESGMGAESSPPVEIAPECPATAPTAPLAVTAAPLCESTNVGWNAPTSDGGVPVTSYTVYVRNGEQLIATDVVDAGAVSDVVSGLTDGTSYTVTVVATNEVGSSPESSPPVSVTPVCVPTAPLSVTAAPLCESANVGWNAPASDGGSAITSYTVFVRTDGAAQVSDIVGGGTLTDTVSGLTDGTPYTVTVVATNAIGDSVESSPPVSVTPVCAPTAPLSVTAAPLCESTNVGWNAPASDNGSTITGYTVFVRSGSELVATDLVDASALSDVVSGLTDGTSYTVTVVASNAVGSSVESSPPVSVTPVCAPTVPLSVQASATCGGAAITWSVPANGGGSPITSYTVFVRTGSQLVTDTVGGSTLTDTISGLSGGTTYAVTVAATNAIGTSQESSPPVSFTPTCIATTLSYTGALDVRIPAALTMSAQLSSAVVGCRAAQPIVFSLDRNPITQAAGAFALGTKKTGGSGLVTFPETTKKWQPGSYTVTVSYAGTPPLGGKPNRVVPHCTPATDSAPITAYATPTGPQTAVASGAGTIATDGSTSFAFTITVPRRTTNYTGVFVLNNGHSWRVTGSISGYTKLNSTTATATGAGDVYFMNSHRTWQLAASGANVVLTISTGGKKRGKLGIEIDYTPVPPQPSQLPNTSPIFLTGGTITVH